MLVIINACMGMIDFRMAMRSNSSKPKYNTIKQALRDDGVAGAMDDVVGKIMGMG